MEEYSVHQTKLYKNKLFGLLKANKYSIFSRIVEIIKKYDLPSLVNLLLREHINKYQSAVSRSERGNFIFDDYDYLYIDSNLINATIEIASNYSECKLNINSVSPNEVNKILCLVYGFIYNELNVNGAENKNSQLYLYATSTLIQPRYLRSSIRDSLFLISFLESIQNKYDITSTYIETKKVIILTFAKLLNLVCNKKEDEFIQTYSESINFLKENGGHKENIKMFQASDILSFAEETRLKKEEFIKNASSTGGKFAKFVFGKMTIETRKDEIFYLPILNSLIGFNFSSFRDIAISGNDLSKKWEEFIRAKFEEHVLEKNKIKDEQGRSIEMADIIFKYDKYVFVGELKFKNIWTNEVENKMSGKGLWHFFTKILDDLYFSQKNGVFPQRKNMLRYIKKLYPTQIIINFTIQPTLFSPKYPTYNNTDSCYINDIHLQNYHDENYPKVLIIPISKVDEFVKNPASFVHSDELYS